MKMRYILIICILVGCIGCSEKNVIEDSALAQVVEQVWPATDSAMAGWQQINAQALNDYDYHRYRLAEAHLRLKHGAKLPTELDMVALAEYFANRGDMASAGEASFGSRKRLSESSGYWYVQCKCQFFYIGLSRCYGHY